MGKAAFIGGFFYHCDKTSFILLIVRYSEMMIWRYRYFRAYLWSEKHHRDFKFYFIKSYRFPGLPET